MMPEGYSRSPTEEGLASWRTMSLRCRGGAVSGTRRDAAEGALQQFEKCAGGVWIRGGAAFVTAYRITPLPN